MDDDYKTAVAGRLARPLAIADAAPNTLHAKLTAIETALSKRISEFTAEIVQLQKTIGDLRDQLKRLEDRIGTG